MSSPGDRQNPYAPPSAELGAEGALRPRRLGWRIYFWLIVVLFLLSWTVLPFAGRFQPLDLLDVALSTVGALGLFGYAHSRALLTRPVWIIWLPVQVVWDLFVNFVLVPRGLIYALPESEPISAVEVALSVAILLPLYVSLYLYAFRSDTLWEQRLAA